MLGQRLLDVLQRGPRLVALDHAVNLLDVADQIGATELELLAAATRAQRIRIYGHDETPVAVPENGEVRDARPPVDSNQRALEPRS